MKNTQNKITKISFLLIEEFSMIAFASAIEPLRTANRISKEKLFEWEFLSLNKQKVFCSNGISIDTQDLNQEKLQTDILFVCGGINIKDKVKDLNESDKKKIKKLIRNKSIKDIVRIFSQEKNISKSKIYNYCLKIKNEK